MRVHIDIFIRIAHTRVYMKSTGKKGKQEDHLQGVSLDGGVFTVSSNQVSLMSSASSPGWLEKIGARGRPPLYTWDVQAMENGAADGRGPTEEEQENAEATRAALASR